MGTDVQLWVKADPSPERLEMCEKAYLDPRRGPVTADRDTWNGHVLNTDIVCGVPIVEVSTLDRYYFRGDASRRAYVWPRIWNSIKLLQELFPESPVYYHGDSMNLHEIISREYGWGEETVEMTEARLSELWSGWLLSDECDLGKDVAW